MRKLVVMAIVLGLLAVVDLSAKSLAEQGMEERAAAHVGASSVRAAIRSLPFIPRVLLTNRVPEVHFELADVTAGSLVLPEVVIDLQGVEIDGDRLRSDREVELRSIDRGRLSFDLTQRTLSDALGQDIRIGGGRVQVSIAGRLVGAAPSISEGALVLKVDGPLPALRLPIPQTDIVPCVASVTVLAERLRVSCSLEEIPPALIRAVNATS